MKFENLSRRPLSSQLVVQRRWLLPFARPVSPGWLGSPSKINGCPCTLQTLFICVTPFQPTTAVSYALSSIPYDSLPFLSVPQSTQSTATATGHRYSTTTPRLHGQTEALRRSVRHGAGPARLAGAVVPSLGPPAGLVDSGGQVGDRDPLRPVAKDFVRGKRRQSRHRVRGSKTRPQRCG